MESRCSQAPGTGMRLRISALVLAAGSGSRLGYRPKCLLEREGISLIRHQLAALRSSGVTTLTVVLGHYADRIAREITNLPIQLLRNPDPEAGQVSSLRLGLASLPTDTEAVIVALADQPLIGSREIIDLICAYKNRPVGTGVVQPTVDALPGNPVMFSSEVAAEILQGGPNMGCRQWQTAHPDKAFAWPTNNIHYRLDVDSEADIEAIARISGLRLGWPALTHNGLP